MSTFILASIISVIFTILPLVIVAAVAYKVVQFLRDNNAAQNSGSTTGNPSNSSPWEWLKAQKPLKQQGSQNTPPPMRGLPQQNQVPSSLPPNPNRQPHTSPNVAPTGTTHSQQTLFTANYNNTRAVPPFSTATSTTSTTTASTAPTSGFSPSTPTTSAFSPTPSAVGSTFVAVPAAKSGEKSRVNVNFCTVDDLLKLPGIDRARAEHIIAVRNKMSFFLSFSDFVASTQLPNDIAVKLEPLVSISPQAAADTVYM